MLTGFVIGAIRFIVEFSYGVPLCGLPDNRPGIIKHVHFLYFAFGLFLLSGIVCIVVSLLTEPLPEKFVSNIHSHTQSI